MPHSEVARVIALAGRRIDAPDADVPRFPLSAVADVRRRLRRLLLEHAPGTLVASAACGADLIGLAVAEDLGFRCRIVLPLPPARFRETSVVDRPGDWGAEFDRLIARVGAAGDLVLLDEAGEGSAAYAAGNEAILNQAEEIARPYGMTPMAVVVWNGASRGPEDLTAAFASLARSRGWPVLEILTLTRSRDESK